MDAERFDTTTRMFGVAGRRRLLTVGLSGALGGLLGRLGVRAQPVAEAASCAKVGKACRHAEQCCSGVCSGKHGKKKCRSHDAGTCTRGQDACTDPDPAVRQVQQRRRMHLLPHHRRHELLRRCQQWRLRQLRRDADCLALGFPPGSACLAVGVGRCAGFCPSGTACNPPCPTAPPPAERPSPDLRIVGGDQSK